MTRTTDCPALRAQVVLALAGAVLVACASAEPDYSVQAPSEPTGQGGHHVSGSSGYTGSSSAGKGGSASGQGVAGQDGGAGTGGAGAAGSGSGGMSAGKAGSGSSGSSGQTDAFGGSGGQAGTSSQGGAGGTGSAGGQAGTSSGGTGSGGTTGGAAGQGGTASSGGSGQTPEPPAGALVIGEQVETTTQLIVQQEADPIVRVVASGTTPCKLSGSPFFTKTTYAYAQVYNPNAQPAQVELGVGALTGQPAPNLPVITAYASLPATDADRAACLSGAEVSCSVNSSLLSCLSGKQAPTIPAYGAVWVYVGNFAADDPAVSFVLHARVQKLL